jgi:tetratricopeptide (TPR) repeat protein
MAAGAVGRTRRYPSRAAYWRDVWQIPCFLLGLACLACSLWYYFGPASYGTSPRARYQSVLDALDSGNLDLARGLYQTQQASIRTLGDGDIAYLEGSMLLADARKLWPLPLKAGDGRDLYARAKAALIKAQQHKLNNSRLFYRLSLADIGATAITPQTLDALEQSLDINTADRPEGWRLLVQLRQNLQPTDVSGAMRAVDLLLGITPAEQQSELRLKKAILLAQLERWTDIPRTLAGLSHDAAEYPQALQWQARAAYELKQWGEAARLWALVPPREMTANSLYFAGYCQQQLHNTNEARKLWERVWREHLATNEAIAAQAALAEMAMEQARWHDAIRAMTTLLASRKPTTGLHGLLTVQGLHEKTAELAEKMISLRRWEDLRMLGEAAIPWEFAGKPYDWLSLAWHELAEPVAGSKETLPAATKAYAQAADYAWRAAQLMPLEDKPRLLLLSGQDAIKAKSFQLAQKALGELLALGPRDDLKPRVLLGLAETLTEQKQFTLAAERLREAILIPGSHEATARLRLAHLLILDDKLSPEAGKQLSAAAALAIQPNSGPDARTACHRWAAYQCDLVYHKKSNQLLEAIDACDRALRLATPHPEAAQTRYLLAELLLADARPSSVEIQAQSQPELLKKQAEQLWQACQHFQQAAEELRSPDVIIKSTQTPDAHIRYARFGQADCWVLLGQLRPFAPSGTPNADTCWQKAGDIYRVLSEQKNHRVDALWAHVLLSECLEKRGQPREMEESLRNAEQLLQQMTDEELKSRTRLDPLARSQWEAMLHRRLTLARGLP